MMTIRHFIYSIATFGLSLTMATAQTQVSAFIPGEVAEGVNYALPRTIVNVEVATIKTVYTPGEFARYAERYLHLTNINETPETSHEIQRIKVYTSGTPDTTKVFTVKLKDKSIAPLIQLTDEGVITAINTNSNIKEQELPSSKTTSNKLNSKSYLTEEILSANSTAKMAELTAQEIYNIRESRSSILKGQVDAMPKDGASLKIITDGLNEQEAALLQLFTGYTDTTYYTEGFSVDPTSNINKEIIFRFSKKLGFVDEDDLAGEPFYIDVKDMHTAKIPTEKESEKRKISGVVYNMPSTAQVKIYSSNKVYYSDSKPFGQFGTIDVLSSTLFNKDATTKVTFDPATGGLLKISR